MSLKDALRGENEEVVEEQKEVDAENKIKFVLPVKEDEKPNIKPYPLYLEEEKKKRLMRIGKKKKRSLNDTINYMIDFCLEHMEE